MTQEALKLALEALEGFYEYGYDRQECFEHITAIKEALAQPEQEPVAWADHGVVNWIADKQFKHAALLYEAPQRTWVGLMDEEIDDIWNRYCDEMGDASINDAYDIAKNIEAALKQNNGYAEEKNT